MQTVTIKNATVDKVEHQGNSDIAYCRTSTGSTLQLPIDQQALIQELKDHKGEPIDLTIVFDVGHPRGNK